MREKKGVAGESPGEPGEVVVRWHRRKVSTVRCTQRSAGIRELNSDLWVGHLECPCSSGWERGQVRVGQTEVS